MSSPEASQEARETAEGAKVESSHGSVKRAILKRLEERYPDKVVPWGDYREAAKGFYYAYFTQVARQAGYSYHEGPRTASHVIGSPRKFIESEIATKYPCMEVPRGITNEWAEKLGISRQRVHQIVAGYGAKAFTKKKRACRDCDEKPLPGRQRCAEHATVRLVCESCGEEFLMSRAEVFARAKQSAIQAAKPSSHRGGGPALLSLCRKDCRKQAGIAFMKANPKVSIASVAMKFGVTRGAVHQWQRAMESAS